MLRSHDPVEKPEKVWAASSAACRPPSSQMLRSISWEIMRAWMPITCRVIGARMLATRLLTSPGGGRVDYRAIPVLHKLTVFDAESVERKDLVELAGLCGGVLAIGFMNGRDNVALGGHHFQRVACRWLRACGRSAPRTSA